MRKMGWMVAGLGLAVVGVSSVFGQPGPFGGPGFGGAPDPVQLLRNPSVKKELELTDEQVAKLPDAVMKAVKDVLDEKQLKRLQQIELQQRGSMAFQDKKVQEKLKITEEQTKSLDTIFSDAKTEMADLRKEGGGGNFREAFKKIESIRKETAEKVQSVLTSDQRKQWKQMIGEEFKMERPGFGGGGGFRKKGASE